MLLRHITGRLFLLQADQSSVSSYILLWLLWQQHPSAGKSDDWYFLYCTILSSICTQIRDDKIGYKSVILCPDLKASKERSQTMMVARVYVLVQAVGSSLRSPQSSFPSQNLAEGTQCPLAQANSDSLQQSQQHTDVSSSTSSNRRGGTIPPPLAFSAHRPQGRTRCRRGSYRWLHLEIDEKIIVI